MVRRQEKRLPQICAGTHTDCLPVQQRPLPVTDKVLIKNRLIDHTQDGPPRILQCDQRRKHRHAENKTFRAVNRVQYPAIISARIGFAVFFTDHAMIGIPRFDQLPHCRFRVPVRLGHRRIIAFGFHRHMRPEQRPDHRPGRLRQLPRECCQCLVYHQ